MIRVPGDKSISHRALLVAALAEGESRISGLLPGADCRSTAACLRALGAEIPELPPDGSELRIVGRGLRSLRPRGQVLDCGNSGTTARLLLGLLAGLPGEATLTGDDSLSRRPMRRVTRPLEEMGARFREEGARGRLPLRVSGGRLRPLVYRSPVASAQMKSALLLAGAVSGVAVQVTEPARSRDHTERMLRRAGARVEEAPVEAGGWQVALPAPPPSLLPLDLEVPGDLSSAAFFLALGLLGGAGAGLRIEGVCLNPTRSGLLSVLERMGGRVERLDGRDLGDPAGEPAGDLRVVPTDLEGVEIRGEEVPMLIDELPVLAVLGSRSRGVTRIRDAGELRVKESDRIAALTANLRRLGVEVEEYPDGLAVEGTDRALKGRVRAFGDHRIAMAFGVLGALPGNEIHVEERGVVDVSFPGFWALLAKVGGREERGRAGPSGVPTPAGARAPVVAIDGPAGSGKSTTARGVARALGYRHLDSGALYRAVTLALLRSDRAEQRWGDVTLDELHGFDIELEPVSGGFRIRSGSAHLGDELRSADVTSRVSAVARIPAVRTWLLEKQRAAARHGGLVADGRDMGTVVFPDADVKVFLVAELRERARRRLLQEGREPLPDRVRAEAARLERRDRDDAGRTLAPLVKAPDAVELDTTGLAFQEQVDRIVALIRDRLGGRGGAAPGPGNGG